MSNYLLVYNRIFIIILISLFCSFDAILILDDDCSSFELFIFVVSVMSLIFFRTESGRGS